MQVVSDVNRQRASKPAYPYKKGRLEYARLEQKIVSIYNCYGLFVLLFILILDLMCSLQRRKVKKHLFRSMFCGRLPVWERMELLGKMFSMFMTNV